MGARYKQSPIGIARHAWVNKPDTKYVPEGLYHVELVLEGEQAEAFQAEIDALVETAYAEEVGAELVRAELAGKKFDPKPWGKYAPYVVELDDAGAPTGKLIVKFKQNAVIKLKDGTAKSFHLGIRDGKNQETDANVFGGATIRVLYKPRNTKLGTAKQFGVRLDFCMVQLIKAAPMSGGGFDEVDEAYTEGAAQDAASDAEAEY